MNRSELDRRVAERTGLASTAAKDAVDAVFSVIAEALAGGEDARITGFGVFGTRARPARTGRNPRTGESVSIAAFDGADVQARQDAEGCGEYRNRSLSAETRGSCPSTAREGA